MRRLLILLPLSFVAAIIGIACSSDSPPLVDTTRPAVNYGVPTSPPGAAPIPGTYNPYTGEMYGAAGPASASTSGPYFYPQTPGQALPPRRIQQLPQFQPAPPVRSATDIVQRVPATSQRGSQSASAMYKRVNVRKDFLPYSARGRTRRRMRPRYITIHSTQNWSRGADANRHSLALKRSKLGKLSWHYTTDDTRAVQHLPTTEQGNHADFNGPGNKTSIGIEMCENVGNNRERTMERTAMLAAWLMRKHNIPISNIVPHYKWPRWGKNPPNKNCPHFLMTNGRPGEKWRAFVRRVNLHYQRLR